MTKHTHPARSQPVEAPARVLPPAPTQSDAAEDPELFLVGGFCCGEGGFTV
jgi:hypothetical protein